MCGWLPCNWVTLADAVVAPITDLAGRVDIAKRRAVARLVSANARCIDWAVDHHVVRS